MKDRLISQIKSGNARDILFDNKGLPSDVGDTNPIGQYNAKQAVLGSTVDNVQSAIEDLYSLTIDPIKVGGVYVSTDATSPAAIKHVEVITFVGDEIDKFAQDTTYFILGENFKFPPLTTVEVMITQILDRFEELVIQEKLITSVVRTDTKVLQFTFIDSVPKDLSISYSKNGVSYTSALDTQGRPGYGTWFKIGQEDKFSETLHYYKRIA